MKNFISINELFAKLKGRKLNTFPDRFSFSSILIIWLLIVVLFGVFYLMLESSSSFLLYPSNGERVKSFVDRIYFSFITATTTGFGDITPVGIFKIIAIIEVIFGLLLLAVVTSKLVSIKQDIILSEIYDISFNERINRLRSSLLVFRQNINRLINKVEENTLRKREINDIYVSVSSFEDVLNEVLSLTLISGNKHFKKVLDPLNAELLLNSILVSFERLNEIITLLNQSRPDWRRELTLNLVNKCIEINESLFEKLRGSKVLPEKTISDLSSQKSKVIDSIKSGLEPQQVIVENGSSKS